MEYLTESMSEFKNNIQESINNLESLKKLEDVINEVANVMLKAIESGNKVIFCGNGGSAADSQHLSAELMGRYMKDRNPMPAISLTVDTSALTAIGNDYGFDEVFSRQLEGIGNSGDVLYATSTSGNSTNILKAIDVSKKKGITTIGIVGSNGGAMANLCDYSINVPSDRTNKIQEMHILIGHYICGFIEGQKFP